jgi:hypothetical protein
MGWKGQIFCRENPLNTFNFQGSVLRQTNNPGVRIRTENEFGVE